MDMILFTILFAIGWGVGAYCISILSIHFGVVIITAPITILSVACIFIDYFYRGVIPIAVVAISFTTLFAVVFAWVMEITAYFDPYFREMKRQTSIMQKSAADSAKFNRAYNLSVGEGVEKNQEEAARILQELAQKGEPFALYCLWVLLSDRDYAGYKPEEGIALLHQSAEQDFIPALRTLGALYYDGHRNDLVKQDWQEAWIWLQRAAEKWDYIAQYYLGEMYFNGNGVSVDYDEAFRWYKKSSKRGSVAASQKLAHCYLNGIGIPKNESEGYTLLALLASLDDEEALTLLQSATALGNPVAEYGMGVYYREKNDIDTANQWFEKAADKGDGKALCELALRYADKKDDEQALRYFHLAAENGNSEAMYHLGMHYFIGRGVSEDKTEAIQWLRKAAAQEHAWACCQLSECYFLGEGVDEDKVEAVKWYHVAADKGCIHALYELGLLYYIGDTVPQDTAKAIECLGEAAIRGDTEAKEWFHEAARNGGAEAFDWYWKATKQGILS